MSYLRHIGIGIFSGLCVLIFLSLCSCGDSFFLESGTYDVRLTLLHEDVCLKEIGCVGDTSDIKWKIKGHEDKYELSIVGSSDTKFQGVHKAGSETIDFHYVQDLGGQLGNCLRVNVIDIVLKPEKKAQGFTGIASQVIRLCRYGNANLNECYSCGELLTKASVVGKLQ